MMHYLRFKGKEYRHLNINISVKAPFKAILNQMNHVEILGTDISQEHLRYAVLELVNNSLRAHREKDISKEITLSIHSEKQKILMELKDWGGGFSIKELPYDLSVDYDSIDAQSSTFQSYRERFQYRRFGMGILSTKKVFPIFEIQFHTNGEIHEYKPGETSGTIIRLGVPLNET